MSGTRTLKITILGSADGAVRALSETGASAGRLEAIVEGLGSSFSRVGEIMRGALVGIGFAGVTASLRGVADAFAGVKQSAIDTNATLEQSAVSWGVLLGSTDKANAKIQELYRFAAITPFEFPEVQKASLLLQTFGGDLLNTTKTLALVGDIASGVNQPFEEVAMWVGRMYDAIQSGRPFGEASARLQEMGALSGQARNQLEQMQKEGVAGAQIWAVFNGQMARFNGLMDKQSHTVRGLESTLSDLKNQLLATAGASTFENYRRSLESWVALLSSPRAMQGAKAISDALGRLYATIGTGQAALRGFVAEIGRLLNLREGTDLTAFERIAAAIGLLRREFSRVATDLRPARGALVDLPALAGKVATGIERLARGFQIGVDAIVTFRQALRGDWFGGQTQGINTFVRSVGRVTQLARDAALTFRQAFAGDWFKGGAGNDFVNTVGRIGLALGNAVRAIKPFVPELLILGRAVATITSPLAAFGAAWLRTGGDVRSALNLMRRNVSDGLLALGDLLRRAGPPLAKALWGFLQDAAGDFKGWWQKSDVTGKVAAFLRAELPKLATAAGNLAGKLWDGLGDIVGGLRDFWAKNGVNGKIVAFLRDELGNIKDGATGLAGKIWDGLGDIAAALADYWQKNDVNSKIAGFLQDRLANLGDFAGSIWSGVKDLPGGFQRFWNDNNVGGQIKNNLTSALGKLGDVAGGLWSGLVDLPGKFRDFWAQNDIGGKIRQAITTLLAGIADAGQHFWDGIGDIAAGFIAYWKKNQTTENIQQFLASDAPNWAKDIGIPFYGGVIKAIFGIGEKIAYAIGYDVTAGLLKFFSTPTPDFSDKLWLFLRNAFLVELFMIDVGRKLGEGIAQSLIDNFPAAMGRFNDALLAHTPQWLASWGGLWDAIKGLFTGFNQWLLDHTPEWLKTWDGLGRALGTALMDALRAVLPEPVQKLLGLLNSTPQGGGAGGGGGGTGTGPGFNPGGAGGGNGGGGGGGLFTPQSFVPNGAGNVQALAFGGGGNNYYLTVQAYPIEVRESPEDWAIRIARQMVAEMKNLTQQNGGGGSGLTGGPIL
jgi:hypothetical protein